MVRKAKLNLIGGTGTLDPVMFERAKDRSLPVMLNVLFELKIYFRGNNWGEMHRISLR